MINNNFLFIFKNNVLKLFFFYIFFSNYYLDGSLGPNEINSQSDRAPGGHKVQNGMCIYYTENKQNLGSYLKEDISLIKKTISEKISNIEVKFCNVFDTAKINQNFIDRLNSLYSDDYRFRKKCILLQIFALSACLPFAILFSNTFKSFSKEKKVLLIVAIASVNTWLYNKNTFDQSKNESDQLLDNESDQLLDGEKQLKEINCTPLTKKDIEVGDEFCYIGEFTKKEKFGNDIERLPIQGLFWNKSITFPDEFPELQYYIFAKKKQLIDSKVSLHYVSCWSDKNISDQLSKEQSKYFHPLNCLIAKDKKNIGKTQSYLFCAYIYSFHDMNVLWKKLCYTSSTLRGSVEWCCKGLFNIPGQMQLKMINFFNKKKF